MAFLQNNDNLENLSDMSNPIKESMNFTNTESRSNFVNFVNPKDLFNFPNNKKSNNNVANNNDQNVMSGTPSNPSNIGSNGIINNGNFWDQNQQNLPIDPLKNQKMKTTDGEFSSKKPGIVDAVLLPTNLDLNLFNNFNNFQNILSPQSLDGQFQNKKTNTTMDNNENLSSKETNSTIKNVDPSPMVKEKKKSPEQLTHPKIFNPFNKPKVTVNNYNSQGQWFDLNIPLFTLNNNPNNN
jgi:hypothetical protein